MAIPIAGGFQITAREPVDNRVVLTKAQMAATKKGGMPINYFALCSDDNKLYIFNSNFEADEETGRFRPIDNFVTFTTPEAKEVFEQAILNSDKIENIDNDITEIKTELEELSVDGGEVQGD